METIDDQIGNCLSRILDKMNPEELEYTLNSILKHYESPTNHQKGKKENQNESINITDLYKLLFIGVTTNSKSHNYTPINKIIDASIKLNKFIDTLTDLEEPKELNTEIIVLINFLIQILDCLNPNLKFINEFFDYLIQKDIKNFNETVCLNLSNRNFWGKVPCILNILLSLCHNDFYEFKISDVSNLSKQIILLINNLIKTYPIINTAIEIELIYENEQMGFRQLSISILEKSIEFYKLQCKEINKDIKEEIKEKELKHNKNILITISHKLHLICRRLNDTAYFVRLKCISSLIYLLEESIIPLFFINSVNLLVLNKLKDRTILVRRKCVEYLRIAIAKHSFHNDNNIRKATKKYRDLYETINIKDDLEEKSVFEIDPTFLEGFFYFQNNMNINDLSLYLEELQDKEAINNFLLNSPDKEFYKNSLMMYSHFLYSVIYLFDNYMLYILNTNIKQTTENITIGIQDIEGWMDILIMIGYYGINVTKYLNDCYLISKDFDKECLKICLKSIGKLIKMSYSNILKRQELINFLNEIEINLLLELFKYQQIGIDREIILKEIDSKFKQLISLEHGNISHKHISQGNINKDLDIKDLDTKNIEDIVEIENSLNSLLNLTNSLKIELSQSYLPILMKYLSNSENIITLNFRQKIFRNYIYCMEVNQMLIEKVYSLNCKMNYNDLILDSILIKKIYKNNILLSKIDEIISNILQIIANSGNSLKLYSTLGFIINEHSKYLDLIGNEIKSNLKKLDLKTNDELNIQKKVFEIFKNFKSPKKYKERRKSLAEERSLIRESIMNTSFCEEDIKEKQEVTENDIDDAIFYLKDYEILHKGCLSRIYTQMLEFIRKNIENPKDWNLLTVALTTLYKCMCLSTDAFSNNFDIFKLIITNFNENIPIDLKHNTLITLHDFFINYNSFVENLNYIFFKNLYSDLHSEVLILIINLSKHGILKVNGFWLELILSFNFIYAEFLNAHENLEEKYILIYFLNSLTENNIALLIYECICGILFSDISRFTIKIIENSKHLCENSGKFMDQNFKLFFVKFVLKNCVQNLTEKSKVSLFLRFLRAQFDDSNNSVSDVQEVFDLIFKEFCFSERGLNEMANDENFILWKSSGK